MPAVGNLSRLLGAAAHLSGQARIHFLADLSLTENSLTVLRALGAGGMPVAEVSGQSGLSTGDTAAALAALCAAGYAALSLQTTWSRSRTGQQVLDDLALRKTACEAKPGADNLRQALLILIKTMDSEQALPPRERDLSMEQDPA